MTNTDFSGARELAEWAADRAVPTTIDVPRQAPGTAVVPVAFVPNGMTPYSLKNIMDEYKAAPDRREGTAQLEDLSSFIGHVNRHKDGDSVLCGALLTPTPSLTAIYDYNYAGDATEHVGSLARFRRHRAHYAFPLSEEWKAWLGKNKKGLDQREFSEFIEERIADVANPPEWALKPPETEPGAGGVRNPEAELAYLAGLLGGTGFAGPARLMEMSRGLQIHVDDQITNAVTLQSGETQIVYKSEHKDASGAPIKVPNLFMISIPIFRLGAVYNLAVRLRYRASGGRITWFYEMYRHDRAFDHAVREACDRAASETGVPLFYGVCEAAV